MSEINFTEVFVCPLGKYPLIQKGNNLECVNCGALFPVKEGIPMLLIDDAMLPDGISDISELKCSKENNNPK